MTIINMRPPRIAIVLTLIAAALHWRLNIWETMRFSLPMAGVILGLSGFLLMMWAWWLFRRQALAICPTAATGHITLEGPFRFTRNPMYLGMVVMMSGLAICIGTLPFYLSAIVYFGILNFVFCPYEEDKLAKAFGDDYMKYMDSVGRWL